MKKRFLIVSPHPDDAELGIGGTILKLKAKGHKVFMVDLTSGEPTPHGTEEKRKKETKKSTEVLGLDDRVNLGLENRYLFDTREARELLAEKIRKYRPDVILAPYSDDAHPDHIAATRISERARFCAKFTKTKMKGAPHYTRNLFYYFASHLRIIPQPGFLVDISRHFNNKIKAVKCYRSQFTVNHKNKFIFDYIGSRDRYWGSLIGCDHAEAVFARELFRIEDMIPFA